MLPQLVLLAPLASLGSPENVLILVADDVGVDQIMAYGEGSDYPKTPNIDALAAEGVLFRNAWANPICSPTRSTILTGRHAFRTGVGSIVQVLDGHALPLGEVTLPEMLDLGTDAVWTHGAFGKWHVANPTVGGLDAPNLAGFAHFAGTLGNFIPPHDYYNWPEVVNGQLADVAVYATTRTVDAFLDWLPEADKPWLAYVAFNACHYPFQEPPEELHSVDLDGVPTYGTPRLYFKAVVEAMDTEIGRLLTGLGSQRSSTTVLFIGDNGTPKGVVAPNFPTGQHKGTVLEGGINVPFLVTGPRVAQPGTESVALVSTTDLFATVAGIAGVDLQATLPSVVLDSLSLLPYLADPRLPSQRDVIYTETFAPNGYCPPNSFKRAARNSRFKLIQRKDEPHELYDLELDPFEEANLLTAPLGPEAASAYAELRTAMAELLASEQTLAAVSPAGCGINPSGSLVVLSGSTAPGDVLEVGVDCPSGSLPAGSLPFVGVSLASAGPGPCGLSLPGWGMEPAGSEGELLLGLPINVLLVGPPWDTPGTPVPISVSVPANCSLVGSHVFIQGALRDPTSSSVHLALTEGIEVTLGFIAP